LPDGNQDGMGWISTGYVSLAKLRDGLILSLAAMDDSTTYSSWSDLSNTLGAIVNSFAPRDSSTMINAPDFDRTRQTFNGGACLGTCSDHSDHLAVADLAYSISIGSGSPWTRQWFIDYAIGWADSRYPVNLNNEEHGIKKALFMAYNDKMKDLTGIDEYGAQPTFWENCFWRDYYRAA